MCGRYYFALSDEPSFSKLKRKIEQQALFEYAQEEVFPSQNALLLRKGKNDYDLDIMKWGLEGFKGNRLINARMEGIDEKRTFQGMLSNRCLIPCTGFFEWVKVGNKKQKIYIRKQDEPLFYLAGIYNEHKEFVIVTGESVKEMKQVHHRTPIILKEEQISAYLQEELDFEVDNEHMMFTEVEK